jgi:hypothetical protein
LKTALQIALEQNVARFKGHFGSHPIVYTQICEDLLKTTILEARIDMKKAGIHSFLMALSFLKCIKTAKELASRFKVCEKTVQTKICYGQKVYWNLKKVL